MKFRCASNAAIKKCQNRKKKINFFSKIFLDFRFLEVLLVILTTYLPV